VPKHWLELIATVAGPGTITRWRHRPSPGGTKPTGGPGRPRAPERIAAIVIRMATENQWGVTRIHSELRKLGLAGSISRTIIRNLLRERGFEPGPLTGEGTWDYFIQRHRDTLWTSDFPSKTVGDPHGQARRLRLLRQAHRQQTGPDLPGDLHPAWGVWVAHQARNFLMHIADHGLAATHIICDRDTKYYGPFTTILRSEGIEVKRIAPSAPEMNGHSESFAGTLKRECLDHFIISNTEHMDRLCERYAEFYNTVRPHRRSTMARLSPRGITYPAIASTEDLACESWLGGVLRHYSWKGAA
jgi:hypothetical protein